MGQLLASQAAGWLPLYGAGGMDARDPRRLALAEAAEVRCCAVR